MKNLKNVMDWNNSLMSWKNVKEKNSFWRILKNVWTLHWSYFYLVMNRIYCVRVLNKILCWLM